MKLENANRAGWDEICPKHPKFCSIAGISPGKEHRGYPGTPNEFQLPQSEPELTLEAPGMFPLESAVLEELKVQRAKQAMKLIFFFIRGNAG